MYTSVFKLKYMNEDLLIQKVVKLEGDIEIVKEDLSLIKNKLNGWDDLMNGQDVMIKLLTKMDTERASQIVYNQRTNAEILEIKEKIGLAR